MDMLDVSCEDANGLGNFEFSNPALHRALLAGALLMHAAGRLRVCEVAPYHLYTCEGLARCAIAAKQSQN